MSVLNLVTQDWPIEVALPWDQLNHYLPVFVSVIFQNENISSDFLIFSDEIFTLFTSMKGEGIEIFAEKSILTKSKNSHYFSFERPIRANLETMRKATPWQGK